MTPSIHGVVRFNLLRMSQLSLPKRIFFWLVLASMLLVVVGVAGLIVYVRLQSWKPMMDRKTTIEPTGPMYHDDLELGFAANPGSYQLTEKVRGMPGALVYRVRIEKDGRRATSQDETVYLKKPEVWIFGCSFTWGQGLNDEDTFAYLTQQVFTNYHVMNFGENGYGTHQSLIQMRRLFAAGRKPEAVVIAYIPWHEQRNVADPKYVEALYWFSSFQRGFFATALDSVKFRLSKWVFGEQKSEKMARLHYPKAYLDKEGKLAIRSLPLLPEVASDKDPRAVAVTEAIFDEIYEESVKHGVKPIILRLWNRGPDPQEAHLISRGFVFQDAFVDYSDTNWYIYPWNGHPNAKANKIFAGRLEPVLKKNLRNP